MKTILMSIRKEPFEALLDGRKRHEFRKRFYLKEPCQVVFYVTSPVSAICGVGIFDKPIEGDIKSLVKIIKEHSFSSPESLRSYLEGVTKGYALPIMKCKKINAITLIELKEVIPGFSPPQSYYYLNPNRFKSLLERLDFYEPPDEVVQ